MKVIAIASDGEVQQLSLCHEHHDHAAAEEGSESKMK